MAFEELNSGNKKRDFLLFCCFAVLFISIKFFICLFPYDYGIFRDEFYYISMSDRLGIGYLDVPPIAPLVLSIAKAVFGTELSLHLIPAVTGSLAIIISALMALELGGGLLAAVPVMVCTLFAPEWIGMDSVYSYDTFDKLAWIILLFFVLKLFKTEDRKYWLAAGITAGIGLLCKITILQLGFVLVLSILITRQRKLMSGWQIWAGGALALILFSPYLVWQAEHGFPTLEYIRNYGNKINPISPLEYLDKQLGGLGRLSAPVWIAGIWYFLFHKDGSKFRAFGLAWFILLIICIIQKSKPYLMTAYYSILFSGGAVFLTGLIPIKYKKTAVVLSAVYSLCIVYINIWSIPGARPMLPPEKYIEYSGGKPGKNTEKLALGLLPQHFADRFGWEEMTQKVAAVYQSLTPEEQKKAVIMTANYGEAGAIHYYGKAFGLPEPISGHNQYFIWGPGKATGEIIITVGVADFGLLSRSFEGVTEAARLTNIYMMPYERDAPIYLCRKLKQPISVIWPYIKSYN